MGMRSLLLNSYSLKLADFLSRQQVMHWYDFYNKTQNWSRVELLQYQNIRLKELLSVAINDVPLYRELYAQHNINIQNIHSVDDLKLLPVVTKIELKASYPAGCTRKTESSAKESFTSGSSGNPFAVLVDGVSMSQARALMMLRANYSGWRQGDAVFQTGMTLNRGVVKHIKDLVFNTYYASAFDLSDSKLDAYLTVIKEKKIKYLMGYPGSLYALATRASQTGCELEMRGIVTWGDNLYEHFRKSIEQQFKCRVTDTYGCGEGIQVAAQCPEGSGHYHIFMPHVIVEIVDDKGQPVPRGEPGNILLTKLEPGAMPLIRYKVGDVGRMSLQNICECGCGFDLLEKIEGRESDFIYTPNGNRLIVHFFTGIFEYYTEIDDFRVIQDKIDCIKVEIVPNTLFKDETLKNLEKEIQQKGDKDLKVEFCLVDKITVTKTGKRKFVVNNM